MSRLDRLAHIARENAGERARRAVASMDPSTAQSLDSLVLRVHGGIRPSAVDRLALARALEEKAAGVTPFSPFPVAASFG